MSDEKLLKEVENLINERIDINKKLTSMNYIMESPEKSKLTFTRSESYNNGVSVEFVVEGNDISFGVCAEFVRNELKQKIDEIDKKLAGYNITKLRVSDNN